MFEVVGSVIGIFFLLRFPLKILIGGILAVFHVLGSCASTGAIEMVLHAVLFYVMCEVCVICLKFTNVRETDRKNYMNMILHACIHVFYVHLYAAMAGFLLVLGAHVRLVFEHSCKGSVVNVEQQGPVAGRPECAAEMMMVPKKPPGGAARSNEHGEYLELVRSLQAAKAAGGVQ
jgi:hypothetical protein